MVRAGLNGEIMSTNTEACELANRELEDTELDKVSAAGFWSELGGLYLETAVLLANPLLHSKIYN